MKMCLFLEKGFTKSFYAGKVCDHHAVGNQFPIVIVTAFESKYKTIELGNYINQEKWFTLHMAGR